MVEEPPPCEWENPPAHPRSSTEEIHVWGGSLDDFLPRRKKFVSLLSNDERKQMARFKSGHDRDSYVVRRGLQREILGEYAGLEPGKLLFKQGRFGKPELADATNPHELTFNASSSRRIWLIAVSRRTPVGVDIESIRPLDDIAALIERNFAERERRQLIACDSDEQMEQLFFRYWVCKEASLKATGRGLTDPMSLVSMILANGKLAIDPNGEMSARHNVCVREATPIDNFVAAVAGVGKEKELKFFWFPAAATP